MEPEDEPEPLEKLVTPPTDCTPLSAFKLVSPSGPVPLKLKVH